MTGADLLVAAGTIVLAFAAIFGGAWKLGRSGKAEPALATYKELAEALQAQNDQQQGQLDRQDLEIGKLRTDLEAARVEIVRLNDQVLQRAKVEELTGEVRAGFSKVTEHLDEAASQILGQIAAARHA